MAKVFPVLMVSGILLFNSCNDTEKAIGFEWNVYTTTMQHGDATTAMNSLNRILAMDAYNAAALDTLAILYQKNGMNEAAAKIAFRALNVRESDELVKVLAKANKGMGKHDIALENFQKLLAKDPTSLELLYETAYAYINLGKLNEAIPPLQKMIDHPESGSAVMKEYVNEGSQLVPYKAVAFNMVGYIQTQAGKNQDALRSYEAALLIYPKYYLASNNLKLLSERIAGK